MLVHDTRFSCITQMLRYRIDKLPERTLERSFIDSTNMELLTDTETGINYHRNSVTGSMFMCWESKYDIFKHFQGSPNAIRDGFNHMFMLDDRFKCFGDFSLTLTCTGVLVWCNIDDKVLKHIELSEINAETLAEILKAQLEELGIVLTDELMDALREFVSNIPQFAKDIINNPFRGRLQPADWLK